MGKIARHSNRQWQIFAPDYKRNFGPHWLFLFALFIVGHGLSISSLHYYGEILARPNLGIMLAGLLLFKRRDAIQFLIACNLVILASFPFLDSPWPRIVIAPLLNTVEACLAAMLVRRYCGALIDFSRPTRMAQYFMLAVIPATFFRACAEMLSGYGFLYGVSDNLATMLASHLVSMGLLTPLIVLVWRGALTAPRPKRSAAEIVAWFTLLCSVTLLVFAQKTTPLLFLTYLPLAWIAYRLKQVHAMIASMIVITIAAIATVEGLGPISLIHQIDLNPEGYWQDALALRVSVLQVFAASTLGIALPMSVMRAEEARTKRRARQLHKDTLSALHRVREGEKELRRVALYDRETGLLSRAGIKQAVHERLAIPHEATLYVATLGIERYGSFQSVLGSVRAGQMVKQSGRRIAEFFPDAPIARISPDEITIAFYSTDRHTARDILERLAALFIEPVMVDGSNIDVQFVIGISYGVTGDDAIKLVHQSEAAVVQARKISLSLAFFDANAEKQAASGLTILSDLRAGLDNGDVWLSFQPKLNLNSGVIDSAECLIRWNHPELGAVGPDRFIPLTEETGFIDPLTDWVIEQAIAGQRLLDAQGIYLNMAVNVSVRSLCNLQFTSHIMDIFERCNADPKRFTLELTESAIMVRTRESLVTLKCLRERGFRISIDDFGTGQSSLAYLRHLPADELKIDRAFITDIASDRRDAKLVYSTIALAHSLDLKIVAEGVEDAVALALLSKAGCDVAQGYHVARPMSADKLVSMMTVKSIPAGMGQKTELSAAAL